MIDHIAKLAVQRPEDFSYEKSGSMEKVGMWKGLPTNNEQIMAQPGDMILSMGSSIVVNDNSNAWNFSKLGQINDVTETELKEILYGK